MRRVLMATLSVLIYSTSSIFASNGFICEDKQSLVAITTEANISEGLSEVKQGYGSAVVSHQEDSEVEEKSNKPSRWEVNAAFNFNFSDGHTRILISPQAGYYLYDFFVLGGGVKYELTDYDKNYQSNGLGVNVYAKYLLFDYIVFQLQPEYNMSWRKFIDGRSTRVDCLSLIAGAGLTMPLPPKGYFSVIVHYDLLQRSNSPYKGKLFYSIGYGVRF